MVIKEKDKYKKPVIKVEEIEDDTVTESSKDEEETKIATPLVSSFSQLDSAPASPPENKDASVTETAEESESTKEEKVDTEEETVKVNDEASGDNSLKKEQISSDEVKEGLKDVRPDTTKDVEKGRGPGGKLIFLIIFALLVLGAIVGGILYFQKGVSEPTQQETTPTETPKETLTPTPVKEEEIDLKTISISILNGSGIAGKAGQVKDLLSKGGFSEENIITGNADSYDYKTVSVSLKDGLSEKVINTIQTSLSDDYKVEVSEDNLQENSTYDVVII